MMVENDITKYLIFNPCGEVSQNTRPLSRRKNNLSGQRLGILDNSKWNANKLLRGSARELSEMIEFSEINYYVKPHGFSNDAPEKLLDLRAVRVVSEMQFLLRIEAYPLLLL